MPPAPRGPHPAPPMLRMAQPPATRRSPSSSPRSTPRSTCVKPVVMYTGIALYASCLLFWWLAMRGDANRLQVSRWSSSVLPHTNSELYAEASSTSNSVADTLLETFARGIGASTPELLELHRRHHIPDFKCIGWRQTEDCSPDGPRDVGRDMNCGGVVNAGASGYCLLRDEATGQEVQAMRLSCTSLRNRTTFKCSQAVDFVRVAPQKHFKVDIFQGGREFVKTRMCYGDRFLKSKHFQLTPWENLPWHNIEDTLLDYARDASQL
ncbi:hypothetical protein PF006_g10864 [Phytophthora fragariae]|uniref:Uncharacterized protein n=1 Tax=Phytophthora fragariae TaxID=53985 RepID=A0A6A3TZ36_9STRA|nr:hypothetical protein PF009_g12865 [Phytophthora fragariae]KAE9144173.1 hypothetical protein PF006_g10864 [Phytophthora fragariae]